MEHSLHRSAKYSPPEVGGSVRALPQQILTREQLIAQTRREFLDSAQIPRRSEQVTGQLQQNASGQRQQISPQPAPPDQKTPAARSDHLTAPQRRPPLTEKQQAHTSLQRRSPVLQPQHSSTTPQSKQTLSQSQRQQVSIDPKRLGEEDQDQLSLARLRDAEKHSVPEKLPIPGKRKRENDMLEPAISCPPVDHANNSDPFSAPGNCPPRPSSSVPSGGSPNSMDNFQLCLRCGNIFSIATPPSSVNLLTPPLPSWDPNVNRFCSPCYMRLVLCSAMTQLRRVFAEYQDISEYPLEKEMLETMDMKLAGIANEVYTKAKSPKGDRLTDSFDVQKKNPWVREVKRLGKLKGTWRFVEFNPWRMRNWREKVRQSIMSLVKAVFVTFFPHEVESFREFGYPGSIFCNGHCDICKAQKRESRRLEGVQREGDKENEGEPTVPLKFPTLVTWGRSPKSTASDEGGSGDGDTTSYRNNEETDQRYRVVGMN